MNLDKKMVWVGDEEQLIELTWKSCTNSAFGSIYVKDNVTRMKLCKLILDRFDQI